MQRVDHVIIDNVAAPVGMPTCPAAAAAAAPLSVRRSPATARMCTHRRLGRPCDVVDM